MTEHTLTLDLEELAVVIVSLIALGESGVLDDDSPRAATRAFERVRNKISRIQLAQQP